MLGAAVRTCEQCIFPVERDRTDGAFDGVVVELDAAIVDEVGQAFPARQGVTDGFGELALLTDQTKFCPQPRFKGVDERPAFLWAEGATFVGAAAADVFVDGIERGDMFERFAGNRRGSGSGELVEVTSYMRPAERKPDVAAIGQLTVAGIAIDLQNSLEALEVGDRPLSFAIGRVDIGNARWIRPTPGTVVGGIGPKLAGLGAATAGMEYGHGGSICEQPGQIPEPHEEALMQRAQVPGGMADPVSQRRPIQIDALT